MKRIIILIVTVIIFGCGQKPKGITPEVHLQEVEQWHSKRVENLKGPQGWLNVAGLYWLKEGMNTFGSAENNDVVFPSGKIGEHAGYFILNNRVVTMEAGPTSEIKSNNVVVTKLVAFHPDSSAASVPR